MTDSQGTGSLFAADPQPGLIDEETLAAMAWIKEGIEAQKSWDAMTNGASSHGHGTTRVHAYQRAPRNNPAIGAIVTPRTTRRDLVIRRDGLSQVAVVGLLVALAVLVPWLVLLLALAAADVLICRWAVRQWRDA